jgi:hypothetical protein
MSVPKGIIMGWGLEAELIPEGWTICNGSNGTPDLRDRFILCAGITFPQGETGGDKIHEHSTPTNPHSHLVNSGSGVGRGTFTSYLTDSKTPQGDLLDKSLLPPYHSLIFIMKT